MSAHVKKIVIVGGGEAGWMTAAAMSKLLNRADLTIELVESLNTDSVGAGEGTIPQIKLFHQLLGINEDEFIRKTKATFKYGIEFVNWQTLGHSYMHPFGSIGQNFAGVEFHHYWNKMMKNGTASDLQNYSFNSAAAKSGKVLSAENVPHLPLSNVAYAYHFDASLYVAFLKEIALNHGVKHVEAIVDDVHIDPDNGHIEKIILDSGASLSGDLFIDCSGFRGLLIEEALKTGYESWQHWLPCDSAIVVPSIDTEKLAPYTRSTAQVAGWQWKIPLQHEMGNGFVYSSQFISDDQAKEILLRDIEGEVIDEPKIIRFKAGIRHKQWHKNCVAIGLSSGFVEPLESTAIHLIQSAISRLMALFPTVDMPEILQDTYNKQSRAEMEKIRDFIILHYKVTDRDDSEFWRYCRDMDIPDTLINKIELFCSQGRIFQEDGELFNPTSWLSVMVGQGLMAQQYHPLVDNLSSEEIINRLNKVENVIKKTVEVMPTHPAVMKTTF